MIIGNRVFDTDNNFYIMGIVNATPDSFSDGGKYNTLDKALFHIEQMIKDGADIIDIGGESTKPNYTQISDEQELERILPLLKAVKERFDIVVSLDSYKPNVVKETLAYIDMVNDIYGLKYDSLMAKIIAENNLSCCIMHNRDNTNYNDFWCDVISDIKASLNIVTTAGIDKNRIMIDAGVGFAKSHEQNLIAINKTDLLTSLNYPILIATSNKGFIGRITGADVGDRIYGTVATTVAGALKGASFFRVHDVKPNKEALLMARAIIDESI